MIVNLSHSQLAKHNKRIQDFLVMEREGLKEKLSLQINLCAQNEGFDINPSDSVKVPRINYSTNADDVYTDYFYDPAWDYDERYDDEDKEFSKWIMQMCNTGEIFAIIFPSEELSELEEQLLLSKID